MFARVEKPPERRTGKEYKDTDEESRRIIITDAEDMPLVEVSHEKPQQRSLTEFGREEANSLVRLISKLIKHFPVAMTIVLIGVSIHVILERWLGDPKFFGVMPIKYMFDAGDIAVFAASIIMVIRDMWREE